MTMMMMNNNYNFNENSIIENYSRNDTIDNIIGNDYLQENHLNNPNIDNPINNDIENCNSIVQQNQNFISQSKSLLSNNYVTMEFEQPTSSSFQNQLILTNNEQEEEIPRILPQPIEKLLEKATLSNIDIDSSCYNNWILPQTSTTTENINLSDENQEQCLQKKKSLSRLSNKHDFNDEDDDDDDDFEIENYYNDCDDDDNLIDDVNNYQLDDDDDFIYNDCNHKQLKASIRSPNDNNNNPQQKQSSRNNNKINYAYNNSHKNDSDVEDFDDEGANGVDGDKNKTHQLKQSLFDENNDKLNQLEHCLKESFALNENEIMATDWLTIGNHNQNLNTNFGQNQSSTSLNSMLAIFGDNPNSINRGGALFSNKIWSSTNFPPTKLAILTSSIINTTNNNDNNNTMIGISRQSSTTMDSSYDSDVDSNNSDLRRLVQDLVDSGNSTTPEQEYKFCNFETTSTNISNGNDKNNGVSTSTVVDPNSDTNQLDQTKTTEPTQPEQLINNIVTNFDQLKLETALQNVLQEEKQQQSDRNKSRQLTAKPSNNRNKKKRKSKKQQPQQQQQQQIQTSEKKSNQSSQPQKQYHHEDVDRTTSETLSQEYREYVTHKMITKADDVDPEYLSRMEYGKKLGYKESQIEQALEKLGYKCHWDEFVSELVQIEQEIHANNTNTNNPIPFNHQANFYYPHQPLSCSVSSSVLLNNTANNHNGGHNNYPTNSNKPITKTMSSPVGASSTNYNSRANPGSRTGTALSTTELRPIVIDGSNVAISHGKQKCFSCKGLEICAQWFKSRGHSKIFIFVPSSRKSAKTDYDLPVIDRDILFKLEQEGILYFIPNRNISGKLVQPYDDRYILNYANDHDAIIVSNDHYRDLCAEKPEFQRLVNERLLVYLFIEDDFYPPDDPFGQHGPSLQKLLTKTTDKFNQVCPYGRKCTYGIKCKYQHQERCNTVASMNIALNNLIQNDPTITSSSLSLLGSNQINNRPLALMKSLPLLAQAQMTTLNTSILSSNQQYQPQYQKKSLHRTRSTIEIMDNNKFQTNLTFPSQLSLTSLASRPRTNETQIQINDNNTEINKKQQQQQQKHRKLARQLTLNPDADPRLPNLIMNRNNKNSNNLNVVDQISKEKLSQTKSWSQQSILVNQNHLQQQQPTQPSSSLLLINTNSDNHGFNSIKNINNKPFITKSNSLSMALPPGLFGTSISNRNCLNNNDDDEINYICCQYNNIKQQLKQDSDQTMLDCCCSNGGLYQPLSLSSDVNVVDEVGTSKWSNLSSIMMNNNDNDDETFQKRLRICHHLSQLFPKEKVLKAMQLLPNEIDPKIICKEIVSMDNEQNSTNDDNHQSKSNSTNSNLDK